jgi:putative ATP-dependent endonuclease of the OLD family
MNVSKVIIENYKCFKGKFCLELNSGLNILVGDNEAGKSTILEAIHLALTGLLNGRYLRNELTQYIFNNDSINEYLKNLEENNQDKPAILPYILIEVSIEGEDLPLFEGDGNTEKKKGCGVSFKIAFDDKYQIEYEELVKSKDIKTIPIEYYDVFWTSYARDNITARSIPLKSALIDSSSYRYQNGSDIYISRIIRDNLEPEEIVDISQAYRKMKDVFMADESIKSINKKIKEAAKTKISEKDIKLSVDLSSKNAWETSLMTFLDEVPFHNIGRGEQCIVKTNLALSHKKSKEASIILLEEPENHLSHWKMNQLIHSIENNYRDKQILISTHSSFVANKLGLENLILLDDKKPVKLNDLKPDTQNFFKKLAGYDTLRLILCKRAILVEGDSDELIVQKAFMKKNENTLPIEMGVDVISVGTSFLRFLEIAEKIKKNVSVVTDNDGNIEALENKYENYLGDRVKENIKICYDTVITTGTLSSEGSKFNYNTLEPNLLKENSLEKFNKIFGTNYADPDGLRIYMKSNKTECALKIFETQEDIKFPKYILDSL